jgi:predicted nucleotidyltransferase component of viral defense system
LTALWTKALFPDHLFYGGTAIKKLYLPDHRFSEDIDLISLRKFSISDIVPKLDRAHQFLEQKANLFYVYRLDEAEVRGTQTRFLIHYRGFSEIGGSKRFLLDFAQGIEQLPKPVSRKLLTEYRDLKDQKVLIDSLPLEAICADKLALIVDRKRKEPRDIFDVWSVLMKVKSFDPSFFLKRFRETLGNEVKFSVIEGAFRDPHFKSAWQNRLRHQVPDLPGYEIVTFEIAAKLRSFFS